MNEIKSELRKYLNYFRNKKRYQIKEISEIDKILNSREYFEFINKIYEYQNSKLHFKPQLEEIRLCLQCYNEAERIIDTFWEQLLGPELNEELQSNLKSKLRY